MSTEKKTPEQWAEEFHESFDWTNASPEMKERNRKCDKKAFLAGHAQGRKDFIANELRGLLEKAREGQCIEGCGGNCDADFDYSIDELMKQAESK